MKCEIIRDLLPAYCDCVCSIETAAEIESHVDGCADCKKLLDDYRSDIKPTGGAPEKPFRRISEKIFRNKLVIAALAILLAAVLCGVGYLTYGQIVREPHHPSFETIISSQKAKKIVERFCEGDIDYVMENIEIYQPKYFSSVRRDDITEHCRTTLTDFYEKYFKGKNLKVKIGGYCGYDSFQFESGNIPFTDLNICDGSTAILELMFFEHGCGKFLMSPVGCKTVIDESDIDTVDLALNPIEPDALTDAAIINSNPDQEDKNFKVFATRFSQTPEEKQTRIENAAALMENMYCEKAFYTGFTYDSENSRYLVDIGYIFIETSSGKRVMYSRTVRMRSPFYHFEILPEFEPVIIDDGISADNLEKLKKLFE